MENKLTLLQSYLRTQAETRVAIKSLKTLTSGAIPDDYRKLAFIMKSINLTLQALNHYLQDECLSLAIAIGKK